MAIGVGRRARSIEEFGANMGALAGLTQPQRHSSPPPRCSPFVERTDHPRFIGRVLLFAELVSLRSKLS